MFVGFLGRHLLVLVKVGGNFHAAGRCDSLVFSIERLSENKQVHNFWQKAILWGEGMVNINSIY